MSEQDVRTVSAAALAYLGDCVLELCVRRYLVESGLSTSAHLNAAALEFVRAGEQAQAMQNLLPILSEEETAYFRRGRNLGHSSVPKRATVAQYRAATGMETLLGYLHLTGREERIAELFRIGYAAKLAAFAEQNGKND